MIRDHLYENLKESIYNNNFDVSEFFNRWFVENGSSYFFLFSKNLKVTNIQFAELVSLLQSHTYNKNNEDNVEKLMFVSSSMFKNSINTMMYRYHISENHDNIINSMIDSNMDIIKRLVVVDLFYGSSAVFMPPHLSVDLIKLCYISGYIHSCGRNVYIRSIDKIDERDLKVKIKNHINKFPPQNKIFFTPYAHEDFTKYDRHAEEKLREGLDKVKFHVEKFHVGEKPIIDVLKEIYEEHNDYLILPPPGNYQEVVNYYKGEKDVDRTMWLILDRGIDSNFSETKEHYLICYDQLYANACPFKHFDENKPAWMAHDTIPHTLLRAMLNITKPWSNKRTKICDPFVGTGTTLLEAKKEPNIIAECSDKEPFASLLAYDNTKFFTFHKSRIERLYEIVQILKYMHQNNDFDRDSILNKYSQTEDGQTIQDIIDSWFVAGNFILKRNRNVRRNTNFEFTKKDVENLYNYNVETRIIIYIYLRVIKRYSIAFRRKSADLFSAFVREANEMLIQIDELIQWRSKIDSYICHHYENSICLLEGKYSLECSMNPDVYDNILNQSDKLITNKDGSKYFTKKYDIIIADPPYSFNTKHDRLQLSFMYKKFLTSMIKALNNNGQLVLSLPDHSYTGKTIPYFTRKDVVTNQILAICDELNKEVVIQANTFPIHQDFFRPPFFWESEKALRRSILQFRIRYRKH